MCSEFFEFYQNGGLFNHFVTISLGFAAASLWFARRTNQPRWLATCERALVAGLCFGILGTVLGLADVGQAIRSVPPEQAAALTAVGNGIAIIPLAWSLMGGIPLWVLACVGRHRQARAQVTA